MNDLNTKNTNINTLPKHIAIIMDGNGRWAEAKKLPRVKGHQQGLVTTKNIVKHCLNIGIKNLTLFAFSSENIYRPKTEVSMLFELFRKTLITESKKLNNYNICLKIIGDTSVFNEKTTLLIKEAQELSNTNDGLNLFIAANYGGKWDIVQAAKKIAKKAIDKKIKLAEIDLDVFEKHTALAGFPNVDLLIRTGGEIRISNFLLWNIAYSELFFTDIYWPEFKTTDLDHAISNFNSRNRNFGKIIK